MKLREILRFEVPFGSFFLREDSQKPLVLVASGTGFAPIKAIVERMIASGDKRRAVLYWGGRRPADLYMHEIGRASCRERGCPSVSISVVPVSLKKKIIMMILLAITHKENNRYN